MNACLCSLIQTVAYAANDQAKLCLVSNGELPNQTNIVSREYFLVCQERM